MPAAELVNRGWIGGRNSQRESGVRYFGVGAVWTAARAPSGGTGAEYVQPGVGELYRRPDQAGRRPHAQDRDGDRWPGFGRGTRQDESRGQVLAGARGGGVAQRVSGRPARSGAQHAKDQGGPGRAGLADRVTRWACRSPRAAVRRGPRPVEINQPKKAPPGKGNGAS